MSDQNNIRIDVVGNADGFGNASEEAERDLDRLKGASQRTGSALNDLAGKALPRVADEISAVTGVSSELVSGVAALGAGFVAVSVAGMAYAQALREGHAEMVEMDRAIAVSGGYAGMTRDNMHGLAVSISELGTATVDASKKIVTDLVSSGRIGAMAIAEVAGLADNYAAATGTSIDAVAPKLISLFADPAKGAEKLNEQMHFLTAAQLEHIQALVDTGRVQEAQLELASKLKAILPEHVKELGALETAWNGVRKVASSAWDSMLAVGRESTLEEKLRDAQERLKNSADWINQLRGTSNAVAVYQAAVDKKNADAAKKSSDAQLQEREAAGKAMVDQYSKTAKKVALAKKMAQADALLPDGDSKNEVLSALRDQIIGLDKEKAPRKKKADDSVFKEWERDAKAAAKAELELMQYHEQQRDKADALLASYARQDAVSEQRIARSAELALMSDRERVAAQAVYQAQDESARRQEQIIKQITDETERTRALSEEKTQLAEHIDQVREASLKSYDDQKSFEFGWTKTFQRYSQDADNAAKNAETVFASAADGMAEAGTRLAMRQKTNFGDMARSFAQMIIQMQMKQAAAAIVGAAGSFLGMGSSQSFAQASVGRDINSAGLGGYHSGGIAGSEPSFIRYHTGGIAGDEVPAVLQRGEGVFTEGQMKAMGGSSPVINMTVINQGAADGYQAKSSVRENNGQFDVGVMIVKEFQKDLSRNGPMTQGIGQAFGLNRSAS